MCTKNHFNRRCDLMLFNYGTTTRTDFRDGEILPPQEPKLKPRTKLDKKQRPYRLKDTQTMNEYTDPNFPFDMLAVPKEIIRTNCRDVQKAFEKPVDTYLEEVRRSRPRVVMVPAASLDDIKDPKQRQLLFEETYTTTWDKASRAVAAMYDNSRFTAPLKSTTPGNSNPLALEKLIEQLYVHPEFRWKSLTWEREQLRSECDSTAQFWKKRSQNLYR